jgi:hypothetical protein
MAEIGVTMGPWSIGTVIVRGQLVRVASFEHEGGQLQISMKTDIVISMRKADLDED